MATDPRFAGSSLCVVGNLNRDVKVLSIPAAARLAQDGETPVASIVETVGGGGANSALAAAALGASTSFLGKVGADALGERLERTMKQYGVAARLSKDPHRPTGTSIALSFDSGRRHFLSALPASESLCWEDLDAGALDGHAHLLRADVWFSQAMLLGGNERLLRAARHAGMTTSLDLNWDPMWGRANAAEIQSRKAAVRAVLPWVDLAHGNVRELIEFADAPDLDAALPRLLEWGAGSVVIHLGAGGAGFYCGGERITEPAVPVEAPVHTVGTGDVLSVCLMLLHDRHDLDIQQRLRLANSLVAEFMEGRRKLIPPLEN